jgi:hypothetical protein
MALRSLSGSWFWFTASSAWRQLGRADDEEVLFQAARPILLNGIEDVRPNLTERAIFLTLAPIRDRALFPGSTSASESPKQAGEIVTQADEHCSLLS